MKDERITLGGILKGMAAGSVALAPIVGGALYYKGVNEGVKDGVPRVVRVKEKEKVIEVAIPDKPKIVCDVTQLILERDEYTSRSTGGSLYFDKNKNGRAEKSERLCYTLEPRWAENKRDVSSVPEGDYDLVKRTSAKYGGHYHIKDVLNRSHILIHVGNFPRNTTGCVLVGNSRKRDYVGNSVVTMNALRRKLRGKKNMKLRIRRKGR